MSGFQVRILSSFPPEIVVPARALYVENRWIDEDTAPPEFPENAFRGSECVAAAFSAAGEFAGVARVVSDGVSDAYIQDVMVKKEFQHQGIGSMLVRALVDELKKRGIDWIGLVGVPGTEKFYAGCGLKAAPGHTLWLGGDE